jgi:hypothetical protein
MDRLRGLAFGSLATLALGCGGQGTTPDLENLTPSDIVGTWAAHLSPPIGSYSDCTAAATFNADGTFDYGFGCSSSTQTGVVRETGAYTFAPSGRVNFLASYWTCARGFVITAEYGGTAARPIVTIGQPLGYALTRSSAQPFPDDAVTGCFDADWSFTATDQ